MQNSASSDAPYPDTLDNPVVPTSPTLDNPALDILEDLEFSVEDSVPVIKQKLFIKTLSQIKASLPPPPEYPNTPVEEPLPSIDDFSLEKALQDPEMALCVDLTRFTKDPLGFVCYAFPWERGELKDYDGPDAWQVKVLTDIKEKLLLGAEVNSVIRDAVASGHGVGKSALVAWLILWAMATFEDTKGVVTANTKTQLSTKTWPELAKWHRLFIAKHWFKFTATSIYSTAPEHEKTWRMDMIPWSLENTEAFAGLHNKGKRILIVFDEASSIPDQIWEVTEGALTDENTEIIWAVFGNPTRNTGRFHACFNGMRHRWATQRVDSRTAKMANKKQIEEWITDFGEDSDFVRVRVRGEFPSASDHQFIPMSYIEYARGKFLREEEYSFAPKILALDNAWTGGDEIVIGMRQGLRYQIMATFLKNDDDFVIAGHLAKIEDAEKADAVLIDLGYGTGVFSAGKQLNRNWMLIPFGGASPDPGFANLRAHMWNQAKQWLKNGGSIPDDPILCTQLAGPEAYVVAIGPNAGKIKLESKDDMNRRGLESPNRADPLALTFAVSVQHKDKYASYRNPQTKEYDPYADLEAPKTLVPEHDVLA